MYMYIQPQNQLFFNLCWLFMLPWLSVQIFVTIFTMFKKRYSSELESEPLSEECIKLLKDYSMITDEQDEPHEFVIFGASVSVIFY